MQAYRAFWELHEDRPLHSDGQGHLFEGFIPVIAILAYAAGEALEFTELRGDIRAMDRAYLKRAREVREAERAREERAAASKNRRGGSRGRR